MNQVKDEIMDYMKEQKSIQSDHLKVRFRHRSDYERALSSLIDDNKLEEKHINGIKQVRLGMAI
jgi:hypothetical protein